MLIDDAFPQVVGGRAGLLEAFFTEAVSTGSSAVGAAQLYELLPPRIAGAECFLDRLTDLWRYEFGRPWTLGGGRLILGPHVWQPVTRLVAATRVASRFLSRPALERWMARLEDDARHEEVLVEMLPALRFPEDVKAEFESLTGAGNCDADWRVTREGERPVLFDVKRRIADMIALGKRAMAGERRSNGNAPQPAHNADLLFRSVEQKYNDLDPDIQLQGVWVVTALQQETTELRSAFDALDPGRVHFAILGGWSGSVSLLTRREADRSTIVERLGLTDMPGAFEFVREVERPLPGKGKRNDE